METKAKAKFTPLPIREIVTQEVINDIVTNSCGKDCKVCDFVASAGTRPGDNYCSLIYSVEIAYESVDGEKRKLSAMLKTIPRNPFRMKMITVGGLFEKETSMYKHVLPKLIASSGFEFKSIAECLHSFSNGEQDYIAMENLKKNGFKMLDRYHWLDKKHAKFSVKELAKFHALSFISWKGDGALIQEKFPFLVERVWVSPQDVSDLWKGMVANTFQDLSKFIQEKGFHEEAENLKKVQTGIFERMANAMGVSAKFPNVVLHGDAWSNNFMFKYNNDGEIQEMKILDFQVVRVGSRALDLSYLLFTSLQIPLLNNHIEEFLRYYSENFTYYCTKWGAEALLKYNGQELSWECFLDEWEEHKLSGLTAVLINLPAMCAKPEHVPDFEAIDYEQIGSADADKDGNFDDFLKSEETVAKVSNLAKTFLPICRGFDKI